MKAVHLVVASEIRLVFGVLRAVWCGSMPIGGQHLSCGGSRPGWAQASDPPAVESSGRVSPYRLRAIQLGPTVSEALRQDSFSPYTGLPGQTRIATFPVDDPGFSEYSTRNSVLAT